MSEPKESEGTEPVSGHEIGQKLCEVLGIDPMYVKGIQIRAHMDESATVTVERCHNLKDTTCVFEGYHIMKMPKYEVEPPDEST